MGNVGGYNHLKELGVASTIAGQILVGSLGGLFYALVIARREKPFLSLGIYFLLPLPACLALLWPQLGTNYTGFPIGPAMIVTGLGLALAFLAFERTLVIGFRFLTRASTSTPNELEYSPAFGRRALVLGGLGLIAAGGGAAVLRRLYQLAS